MEYSQFLESKKIVAQPTGKEVGIDALSPALFDWQKAVTQWCIKRGRAGLFASTGLGKTVQQCEFAKHVGGRVLIFAPLAVTHQTVREAKEKLDLPITYVRSKDDIEISRTPIMITNYDLVEHFIGARNINGIVLDESAILKGITSKRRDTFFKHFTHIPYRLCCTAMASPNDNAEMAMHSEFLGAMKRTDMLSTFFVHKEDGWHMRGHAHEAFFKWMCSWSIAFRTPDDLGYDGSAFILPPLITKEHFLEWDGARLIADSDGQLAMAGTQKLHGIGDRIAVRKQTAILRCEYAANLAKQADGQAVLWCGLNEESALLAKLLKHDDAKEVKGSDSIAYKEDALIGFVNGDYRLLITKAKIAGWGLNLQNATTGIFVGLNDSQELFFQAVRRLWRYGQKDSVTTHVVLSEHERPIWQNVQRKEKEAIALIDGLIEAMKGYEQEELHHTAKKGYVMTVHEEKTEHYHAYHGDCIEALPLIPDNSIGLTVTSPPFSNLYQYHASERDIGNCTNEEQFFTHYGYVANELLRVTIPGRLVAMHVTDIPAMHVRDGWIGLKNFSGHMVDHMVEHGWLYHGRYILDRDPQAQAIRIRAKGLAFGQLHKDSSWMRGALPDYILLFRKPGENPTPIIPDVDNETWIEWAHPVWYSKSRDKERGIRETYTLNVAEGKDAEDDKHICPFALDLVERCVRLWSSEGDHVCDPNAGLFSTGFIALQHNRFPVCIELKESYFNAGIKNLQRALTMQHQGSLF